MRVVSSICIFSIGILLDMTQKGSAFFFGGGGSGCCPCSPPPVCSQSCPVCVPPPPPPPPPPQLPCGGGFSGGCGSSCGNGGGCSTGGNGCGGSAGGCSTVVTSSSGCGGSYPPTDGCGGGTTGCAPLATGGGCALVPLSATCGASGIRGGCGGSSGCAPQPCSPSSSPTALSGSNSYAQAPSTSSGNFYALPPPISTGSANSYIQPLSSGGNNYIQVPPPTPSYSIGPNGGSTYPIGVQDSYSQQPFPAPPPPDHNADSYTATAAPYQPYQQDQINKDKTQLNLNSKLIKPAGNSKSDLYDDKAPDIGDYDGALAPNSSITLASIVSTTITPKSDILLEDYSDNLFKNKAIGSAQMPDGDSTGDPKCSSETLRLIMQENIVSSPTISKQLIFSAGRLAFGQSIDVVCSKNKFSYTVVSSKMFCEASKGQITCFAFLQP